MMESTMTTEPNITPYVFNWKISRFDMICPKECSNFSKVTSERFTVKLDEGTKTLWSVNVSGSSGTIDLFLTLESATKADGTNYSGNVVCRFSLSIGNDDKNRIVKPGNTLLDERTFTTNENGRSWGWTKFCSIEELCQARETLLQNNVLHIRVDMRICGKHSTVTTLLPLIKSEDTVNHLEVLSANFGELFNNKTNSDVEIICGNETFFAHKAILSARSKVFTAMLASHMQETATSKIILTDIDTAIIHAILLYIYTGKVEINDTISYTELIYGAEKYDLAELKQYCFEQMCKTVTKETIGNLAVAAEVYNADEKIRKPIKEYCQRNIAELTKDPAIKTLMISHPKAFL